MSGNITQTNVGAHYEVGRVAVLLDMSTRWVKERIKDGELEGYRLGNRIVVPEKSIKAYLVRHRMSLAGDAPQEQVDLPPEPVAA